MKSTHVARGLAVMASFVVACERVQDTAAERLVEKVLAENGREATVEFDRERGEITVDLRGVVAPEGWPGEVPIYPEALRAHVDSRSKERVRVSVTTTESVAKLAEYYRQKLAAGGWKMSEARGAEAIRAERGDRRLTATFSEASAGAGSRVRIEVTRPG